MPIQDKYSSQIRNAGLANPPVYKLTNNDSPQMHHLNNKKITNYKFASSSHYKLTNPSINRLVNQPTQKLINIQTQKLKFVIFILQNGSKFHFIPARKQVKKQVNYYYFQSSTPFIMSIFKNKTCILHHFSFLDWLPTHYYFHPITCFLPLKTHFLTTILPFLAMCFMDRRGIIYTITAYIYAFRIAFSTILPCVLHHFTLRLAPKHTAFCGKLHCIQHQNAGHLAPYYTTFC